MSEPGEAHQKIGEAYTHVFLGALETNIAPFRSRATAYDAPEKLIFDKLSGKSYSFDACGDLNPVHGLREVFLECKGYERGSSLLQEFREFVAKAYLTSVLFKKHKNDFFWFVTNVPFACEVGRKLLSATFLHECLTKNPDKGVASVLGDTPVDQSFVGELVPRVGVFILTDSYLKTTDIQYRPKIGEHLWRIAKKLHGGRAPNDFEEWARKVARKNALSSPHKVVAGKEMRVSWLGMLGGSAYEDDD